jgi:hypothetical protein
MEFILPIGTFILGVLITAFVMRYIERKHPNTDAALDKVIDEYGDRAELILKRHRQKRGTDA